MPRLNILEVKVRAAHPQHIRHVAKVSCVPLSAFLAVAHVTP